MLSVSYYISDAHSGRATVSRSELTGQNGIATAMNTSQTTTANSSPNPKTLLGRIGIRKPSLFSLSSSSQPTHTARTFSLDDLFKQSSSSKTNPDHLFFSPLFMHCTFQFFFNFFLFCTVKQYCLACSSFLTKLFSIKFDIPFLLFFYFRLMSIFRFAFHIPKFL